MVGLRGLEIQFLQLQHRVYVLRVLLRFLRLLKLLVELLDLLLLQLDIELAVRIRRQNSAVVAVDRVRVIIADAIIVFSLTGAGIVIVKLFENVLISGRQESLPFTYRNLLLQQLYIFNCF